MALTSAATILDHCRVAPQGDALADLSLPVTIFDAPWLNFHPMPRLLFYQFQYPKSHFVLTIIPMLKESLALTLKHFRPLAGNLVYLLDSGKPELRYVVGDSIPLTFAESSDDFNYLVGNYPRNTEKFYPLVPQLPQTLVESGAQITPVFAVQVTLFPNSGLSIGFTEHHVIGDASTIIGFLRAWASINKFRGDAQLLAAGSCVPFYDRSPLLKEKPILDSVISKEPKTINFDVNMRPAVADKVRATYTLSQADIEKIKNFALAKIPNLVDASSFTITCAYIWICWLKSMDAVNDQESVNENVGDYFVFSANFRARLDPPIPAAYFGNCIVPCIATSTHGALVGSEGFSIAAQLIGDAINGSMHDGEGILRGAWISGLEGINWQRSFGVTGLLNADIYDSDFGWGKPEKFENIAIDSNGAMSLEKSSKFEGGLELGLSMPKNQMDAFATIFNNGLRDF